MRFLKDVHDKLKKKYPVLLFDGFAIMAAWFGAYALRYNLHPFSDMMFGMYSLYALSCLMVTQVVCYYYFKVYRGLWRFSSLNDVLRIIQSVITATLVVIPLFYYFELINHVPRSILPLYAILLLIFLSGGRLCLRLWKEKKDHATLPDKIKRVVIIGAGRAGESLVRDLRRTTQYLPVAFLDDNPAKKGQEIHGVRVLGRISELLGIAEKLSIDLIFIAIPSAKSELMRRIVSHCEITHLPFRTLPGLSALAAGRVEVNALREVNLEDLLGRDQVQLDWEHIEALVCEKRIVVTGGGGSIGSELCRQIMRLNPAKLLIIDNCEFNLYKIDQELQKNYDIDLFEMSLSSVTDEKGIENLFSSFKPDLVFHAAAFKHVPMLEEQIRLAVMNNILGTKIVAQASARHHVKKFVLISTDKAVNPVNVMGASKRIAEIFCQNYNQYVDTQFVTVRFGNVLGSAGSVIPLFQKQIKEGGPITVTHPDIERYFMTIPEACQLILQAMLNGNGGEIFVLDMGEPVKISYLAEQMIRLTGKEPGIEIQIVYTGLRAGEKLFEELFHEAENLGATSHEKLFKAQIRILDWEVLTAVFEEMQYACEQDDASTLKAVFNRLVPEFCSKSYEQLEKNDPLYLERA